MPLFRVPRRPAAVGRTFAARPPVDLPRPLHLRQAARSQPPPAPAAQRRARSRHRAWLSLSLACGVVLGALAHSIQADDTAEHQANRQTASDLRLLSLDVGWRPLPLPLSSPPAPSVEVSASPRITSVGGNEKPPTSEATVASAPAPARVPLAPDIAPRPEPAPLAAVAPEPQDAPSRLEPASPSPAAITAAPAVSSTHAVEERASPETFLAATAIEQSSRPLSSSRSPVPERPDGTPAEAGPVERRVTAAEAVTGPVLLPGEASRDAGASAEILLSSVASARSPRPQPEQQSSSSSVSVVDNARAASAAAVAKAHAPEPAGQAAASDGAATASGPAPPSSPPGPALAIIEPSTSPAFSLAEADPVKAPPASAPAAGPAVVVAAPRASDVPRAPDVQRQPPAAISKAPSKQSAVVAQPKRPSSPAVAPQPAKVKPAQIAKAKAAQDDKRTKSASKQAKGAKARAGGDISVAPSTAAFGSESMSQQSP